MLVYRVENAQGGGMYRNDGLSVASICDISDYSSARHPHPTADDALMRSIPRHLNQMGMPAYVFNYGFASLEQLKMWLYQNEWRVALSDAGFHVAVYNCLKDAYVGDTQAVFIKQHATLVETLHLCEV